MPLGRTPPAAPQHPPESDADAPATDTENEGSNVTNRPRPRKRLHDDEMTAFMAEIRTLIAKFTKQQEKIQKQNDDIINSMDFISKQYEDMKDKLTKMESERKNHLAHIQSLEQKVENMERFQRQATIEIRNIPVNKKENKQDLIKLVERVEVR